MRFWFIHILVRVPRPPSQVAFRLSLVCLFALTGQGGGVTVLQLYSSGVFGWSTEEASIGMTVMFASSAVGLAVVLPILLKLVSAKTVVVISVGWATATWAFAGCAERGWQLTLALALFALNGIYFPVLRTTISRVFGEAQFGAALGAVATMQQVTNTVAPAAFSLLYSQTVDLKVTVPHVVDDHFGPRLTFGLLPAVLNLIAFGFAMTLPTIEAVATGGVGAGRPGATCPGHARSGVTSGQGDAAAGRATHRRSIQSDGSEKEPLLQSLHRDPSYAWE